MTRAPLLIPLLRRIVGSFLLGVLVMVVVMVVPAAITYGVLSLGGSVIDWIAYALVIALSATCLVLLYALGESIRDERAKSRKS